MEWKDGRLQLPQVTLAAMTSVNVRQTVKAMEYSMRGIDFGDCVLITHRKPLFLPKTIRYAHTSKLKNIDSFNYKMLYEQGDYLHTDFVMIVHADGFVVHPEQWRDEFLDYDYIGSPWPLPKDDFSYRDRDGNICRVGNSVGIRSRRLVNFPKEADLPFEADHGYFNEDGFLCVKNRHLVEAAGNADRPAGGGEVFRPREHDPGNPGDHALRLSQVGGHQRGLSQILGGALRQLIRRRIWYTIVFSFSMNLTS